MTLTAFRNCESLTRLTGAERRLPVETVPTKISALIDQAENGDAGASGLLFEALYAELHRLSSQSLARHGGTVTLSATTLLHEAYLDMASRSARTFPDTARFMGYAARVMRGLIIDYARKRQALKRGGLFEITSLATDVDCIEDDRELTRISEALDALAKVDRSLADVIDLKFFCGFSFSEIAAMQQISERTAQRRWEKARIYLYRSLQGA
jgi:RNA polymerase sigma factor (TIGR02999 family)